CLELREIESDRAVRRFVVEFVGIRKEGSRVAGAGKRLLFLSLFQLLRHLDGAFVHRSDVFEIRGIRLGAGNVARARRRLPDQGRGRTGMCSEAEIRASLWSIRETREGVCPRTRRWLLVAHTRQGTHRIARDVT